MEDRIKTIVDLYTKENKTFREISEIIGDVSPSTVRRILITNGIKIKPKGNYSSKDYHFTSPFKQEVEDIETLKKLFKRCVPVKNIAEQLGVGRKAVDRKIKELGLVRPRSMMSREQYDGSKDNQIIELYNDGKSPNEIAKIVGLSRCGVKNHLKHCGIVLRDISSGLFSYNGKEFPDKLNDCETLYDMYVVQKLSKKDIAETLNVAPSVVNRCLKLYNIHIRGGSEAKFGLMKGETHPNWKGGRTSLYARLREFFGVHQTQETLKRDHYKCQMCGSEHKLQVHHIRHFKNIFEEILSEHKDLNLKDNENELYDIFINDKRFNDLDNLITYCKECHLYKVHKYKKHKDS